MTDELITNSDELAAAVKKLTKEELEQAVQKIVLALYGDELDGGLKPTAAAAQRVEAILLTKNLVPEEYVDGGVY